MKKNLTKITMISGIILIFYHFSKWYLTQFLTPFVIPLLSIVIHGWFFILLILSIIHLARYKNPKPLIIQLIIIIIWIYTPFTKIYIKLDFLIYKDDRKQVIELIEHKKLIPNVSYDNNQIHLPPKFKATSKGGGDVIVHYGKKNASVFFYTYRGLIDNFSGFIYAPNDVKPNEDDFNSIFKDIKKIEKNWYYVTSH
ncbi:MULTISPECIES: hypothetical protein [Bacillus cereus group]|uniref:Uncharacterized protein n=3 Tax=Bacillus cereus group TaxID=86661 RepID=A0A243CYT9_BACTU|nr:MULTISPECIES: hypothetical protein [Bacillus cereus group]EEM56582.1 hypothetical protein bthur0007_56020 [Bacillus thuringiensis serovar monterrey BGSC 4AJ1]EEM86590.1 hypothetical protein bthur0012_53520 [Bacillus thuringiensis serovar pulsiensis BGSC 4CC1]MEB9672434.1 hypothetical protein [Bacillus anthracis]OTW50483.1 hypothetical protein BK699_10765 [Bacillus thuringiensis serovar mexicanensis]OTX06198.1 hypothetical protein BK705_11075 [Bacillus thuringiensis serovar monterrey]